MLLSVFFGSVHTTNYPPGIMGWHPPFMGSGFITCTVHLTFIIALLWRNLLFNKVGVILKSTYNKSVIFKEQSKRSFVSLVWSTNAA